MVMITVRCDMTSAVYRGCKADHQTKIPYPLYSAHSDLSFFKIALKMLSEIIPQLAHSEKESCLPRTSFMLCLLSEDTSDALLGNGE